MRISLIPATALAALVLAPVAGAHVTVQPAELPAGGFARVDVRVPNESDTAGTVKLVVQMPDGVAFASFEPIAGWSVEVERETLAEPVTTEHGEITEQVSTITWTGDGEAGIIPPGAFQDFGLSISVPEGADRDLTFKAVQTYDDGEVARWIGDPDSDEPAPTVSLVEGAADDHDAAAAGEGTEVAAPADDHDGDGQGAPAAVTWIALGLAGAALLAALGAIARGRRVA